MKTAVVVLADGFEEIEAVTPIDLLRRAGVQVIVAGLSGLSATGARGVVVQCDQRLEDLAPNWDALILPGGLPGARNLAHSALLAERIQSTLDHQAWVAAICAAPALVLGRGGWLKGRNFTCYPGMEGEALEGRPQAQAVVVDGTIMTSRGVGTAGAFALKLVEVLAGADKAREVGQAVLLA